MANAHRSNAADGRITFRFHARDLHLVLGPDEDGKPMHFRVLVDGHAPGADHGADIDAAGNGVVTEQRLYQLVRQSGMSQTGRLKSNSSILASRLSHSPLDRRRICRDI